VIDAVAEPRVVLAGDSKSNDEDLCPDHSSAASHCSTTLVLHRQGGRIDRLLAGDAFQPGENATVLVLVALHGEAALFVAVCPSQADEMLLRFAESQQGSQAESDGTDRDRTAHAAVNVLPVADLGDSGRGHGSDLLAIVHKSHLVLIDVQVQPGSGQVGQRPAVIGREYSLHTNEEKA